MQTFTLLKGTKLYRCAPVIELEPRTCDDTDKKGVYVATYPLMSLAMCLEYGKSMRLGVFELQRDIELYVGKYSFRRINPCRYYDPEGRFIAGVTTADEENISHYDAKARCILDAEYADRDHHSALGLAERHGEVFLTRPHLTNLVQIGEYDVPIGGLYDAIRAGQYQADAPEYWAHLRAL